MSLSFMGLLLSALVTGCGGAVPVVSPIDRPPLIEPLPVSVGIYYSEDLRNHKCTGDKGYIAYSWTFELGPPSIQMFDNLFTALFRDVETLDISPKITTSRHPRDIIELRLSKFNGCQAKWPILGTTVIYIAYEAILWSAEGKKVAQWKGQGRAGRGDDLGSYGGSAWEPELRHLAALTSVAMRKAAADFIINFQNEPAVQDRLD